MGEAIYVLEAIRDYEGEKYDTEIEFHVDLNRIVSKKYKGDFSAFMKKEVLNEDYGDLRFEVERLYKLDF